MASSTDFCCCTHRFWRQHPTGAHRPLWSRLWPTPWSKPLPPPAPAGEGKASRKLWDQQRTRVKFWPAFLPGDVQFQAATKTCRLKEQLLPALKRQGAFLHQVRSTCSTCNSTAEAPESHARHAINLNPTCALDTGTRARCMHQLRSEGSASAPQHHQQQPQAECNKKALMN
jgi:hypothetical protein